MTDKPFLTDVTELRRRARQHIEEGAVTDGYRANRETVVKLLNEALATEIVCVLRYKRHYYMAAGIHAGAVADEFLEHATAEQRHVDQIAERITQLGGEPDLNPEGLAGRSHSEYVEGKGLLEMIREDLVAERIVIGELAPPLLDLTAHLLPLAGEDVLIHEVSPPFGLIEPHQSQARRIPLSFTSPTSGRR